MKSVLEDQVRARFHSMRAEIERRVTALMPDDGEKLVVVDIREFDVCRFTYGKRHVRLAFDPMLAIVGHQVAVLLYDGDDARPRRMRGLMNAPQGVSELIAGALKGEI
jgi:hypothetical protein